MKLYERFADKNYHTSIATTFGIDFDAYESIVLPRLRGAGCRNNIVITDSRMLTHALSGASGLPRQAGKSYTVNGARATGVFHPKLFLQLGRRGGRLIIGSANLTASGLAGNLELVEMITCDDTDTGEQRLIAQAWAYLSRFIDRDQRGLASQRDWMLRRAEWLTRATPEAGTVTLADGTTAALLTTGERPGIGSRFAAMIDEPVSRLIVISPYWDMTLSALSALVARLDPFETAILLDPDAVVFPKDRLSGLQSTRLYRRGDFRKGRFIHAKAIIAQTPSADHVLLGSANCTRAALGTDDFAGENEEVCLYRRLPPGTVLDALELSDVLTNRHIIDVSELEEPKIDEDLPFGELEAKMPGQFECQVDVLTWRPAQSIDPTSCTIALLDERGQPLSCQLTPLASQSGNLRYEMEATEEPPSFAQVRFPGGEKSAPAIITQIQRIKNVMREVQSRKIENVLRDLDDETEARLMLLEVLNVLEEIEPREGLAAPSVSIPKARKDKGDETDEKHYEKLSYEEFVAGRRARAEPTQLTHNSLAGSEVSFVRSFLNRVLGLSSDDHDVDDDDDDGLAEAFDLGDETSDAEAALAAGEEFGAKKPETTPEQTPDADRRRKSAQRKATQEQIVAAVLTFNKRTKSRIESGTFNNHDILRLRALLMILCAAGSPQPAVSQGKVPAGSSLQVLPREGDGNSWPTVVGRLLFGIYGGNNPAIRHLYLSGEHDQIPGDMIECWATCFWCFQACLHAPLSKRERARITQYLRPIAERAYRVTLPTSAELIADNVIAVMGGMSERYADRLGVNPAAISDGHRTLVKALFPDAVSTVR